MPQWEVEKANKTGMTSSCLDLPPSGLRLMLMSHGSDEFGLTASPCRHCQSVPSCYTIKRRPGKPESASSREILDMDNAGQTY